MPIRMYQVSSHKLYEDLENLFHLAQAVRGAGLISGEVSSIIHPSIGARRRQLTLADAYVTLRRSTAGFL